MIETQNVNLDTPHDDPPAWDLSTVYPSAASPQFQQDLEKADKSLVALQEQLSKTLATGSDHRTFDLVSFQSSWLAAEKAQLLLKDMETYLHCELSVDSSLDQNRSLLSRVEQLQSRLKQVIRPLELAIQKSPADFFEKLVKLEGLQGYEFPWREERKHNQFLLSDSEEVLIQALSSSGHQAWANLYTELSGKLRTEVEIPDPKQAGGKRKEAWGLAQALSRTYSSNEESRRLGWECAQKLWTEHQDTSAAIINALAGWRLELCQKRSHSSPMDFLEMPLQQNRLQRASVAAMFKACEQNLPTTHKAIRTLAKILKKPALDPWDQVASSPISAAAEPRSFKAALGLIKEAFGQVSPEMADFVSMMEKNQWLEGRVLPNKGTGAYCTEFQKTMEPRVFMTYDSSFSNIVTLAHELGHGFHTWCVKDLRRGEQSYPMSLAETASVFSETIFRDYLLKNARTKEERIEYGWSDLSAMSGFLVNIPVRFDFEKSFYEARKESTLSATELSELMDRTWKHWYGDTYSRSDRMFWAWKLHFSIADQSFYNFPYTFGYLFSLSIYARRKDLGSRFFPTYVNILKDTGRMSAEALVRKHLDEDIQSTAFWQRAFDLIQEKLKGLQDLA